jgi:uncharacterized protein YPO0396
MSTTNVVDIEAALPERLPGTRLQRVEVYNWGTFDRDVWSLDLRGSNTLLTGDIGSGKSTLVDAITTLLLPANRISYNRAAGADSKERTLRSYVEGYYKAERNERTGTTRSVGLRDAATFSVILATFANVDYGSTVTLAQVFRTRESGDPGQPDRFYVVADGALSIQEHFFDFGTDLAALKRRLRASGAVVKDTFPDYGREFRRRLGIESEQAMDLFHQTVSMKAVHDLTEFVRSHMLEPFDTLSHVASLVGHFENLTRAHEAVKRARMQLELLTPLVADLDAHDRLAGTLTAVETRRRALPVLLAECAYDLLCSTIAEIDERLRGLDDDLAASDRGLEVLRDGQSSVKVEIAGHGGDRLAQIDKEIRRASDEQPTRHQRLREFNQHLADAGLDPVSSAAQFAATQARIAARETELSQAEADAQNRLTDASVALKDLQGEARELNEELQSLQSRRNNLPSRILEVRDRLSEDLGIDAEQLPFTGELIGVREDASEWEGAAERVLHNFALSMLVPTAHYEAVAAWINDRHLGARLVYYRVPATVMAPRLSERAAGLPLLLDQLEIHPDTEFRDWMEAELSRRADHSCVESMAQFRAATKAVTKAGQVKDRERHEKNDRRHIDDRRDYVLGWSNSAKVTALISEATSLQRRIASATDEVAKRQDGLRAESDALRALSGLAGYQRWEELDWEALVKEVSTLEEERTRILTASDQLARLHQELEAIAGRIALAEEERERLLKRQATFEQDRTSAEAELADADATIEASRQLPVGDEDRRVIGDLIDTHTRRSDGDGAADAKALLKAERTILAVLDQEQQKAQSALSRLGQRIVGAMANFRNQYPQETTDADASLEAAGEFRELHRRVSDDDLPRFEREFKDYLNQNTIREVAGFAARLNGHERDIRERIETINSSLVGIDYNDGRYIRLLAEPTPNVDVRQFRADLRECTDDIVGAEGDQYPEQKFLQVKRLIDRFKGREGFTDVDRTWTRRVTDVRQWFEFSASERWREHDVEYEHYSDSAGKSGGQKEKLAYTILAASLAYQFKLEWGSARSKSFRFVVIDEAFGRGSEVSTRYALRLFTELGLQLLIVTPLQKIHVIEPHVAAVGFVDNREGNCSRLHSLTITEFRRRTGRAGRAATRSA